VKFWGHAGVMGKQRMEVTAMMELSSEVPSLEPDRLSTVNPSEPMKTIRITPGGWIQRLRKSFGRTSCTEDIASGCSWGHAVTAAGLLLGLAVLSSGCVGENPAGPSLMPQTGPPVTLAPPVTLPPLEFVFMGPPEDPKPSIPINCPHPIPGRRCPDPCTPRPGHPCPR
jgi:hypothetical protein